MCYNVQIYCFFNVLQLQIDPFVRYNVLLFCDNLLHHLLYVTLLINTLHFVEWSIHMLQSSNILLQSFTLSFVCCIVVKYVTMLYHQRKSWIIYVWLCLLGKKYPAYTLGAWKVEDQRTGDEEYKKRYSLWLKFSTVYVST